MENHTVVREENITPELRKRLKNLQRIQALIILCIDGKISKRRLAMIGVKFCHPLSLPTPDTTITTLKTK